MLFLRNNLNFFTRKNLSLISSKMFHRAVNEEKFYEEVRIPVPWGHIAGKWWGPKDRRPIFVIHGWQDNCGSFDRLIPLLPNDLGFLTIDFPGHGLSTRLPNGIYYYGFDATILLKRIQDYFAWEKMSILSHSMGGMMSFAYTSLFPNQVDMLICIDSITYFKMLPDDSIKMKVDKINKFLHYEKQNRNKNNSPKYTYKECIEKQHLGSNKSINPENCKYVLNRSIEQSHDQPDKYFFTQDPRIKIGALIGMGNEDILAHGKHISCPNMVLLATIHTYHQYRPFFCADLIKILSLNKQFEYHYIEGTHHVHLNNPEKVAKFVNNFLARYAYVDRRQGGIKNEIIVKT